MKYPILLRIFGVINLFLGIVVTLLTLIYWYHVLGATRPPLGNVLIAAWLTGAGVWLFTASAIWFFASRTGYAALAGNALALAETVVFLVFLSRAATENEWRLIFLLLTMIPGILLLFHGFALFYQGLRDLRSETLHIVSAGAIATLFVLTMVAPFATFLGIQRFGFFESVVPVQRIVTGGDLGDYGWLNMVDGRMETWWTPVNHTGKDTSFTLFFERREITGLRILPGSHFPNFPKYGDVFPKNSRLKTAELVFGDGSKQVITLDDEDRLQHIRLKPVWADTITLRVLSTTPGSLWNDLCISEIAPLTRAYEE